MLDALFFFYYFFFLLTVCQVGEELPGGFPSPKEPQQGLGGGACSWHSRVWPLWQDGGAD